MIPLHYDSGKFIIRAGPRDTSIMRQIPGARYVKDYDFWVCHAGLSQAAAIRCAFEGELELSDEAQLHIDRLDHASRLQNKAKITETRIQGFDNLFPFQAAGVRFLYTGRRALLADEMGTGKTVQALAAVDKADAYPLLVVCPNSVKHNWAREVRQWTGAEPFVVGGTARQRRDTIERAKDAVRPVVIINYEALRLHTRLASFGNRVNTPEENTPKELNDIDLQAVVVDEAHRIKDPSSKQSRAVYGVSRNARLRYALTGTPVVSNPDDLWAIMHFVEPEEWPARSRFRDRYCIMRAGWHGGMENLGLIPERKWELDQFLQPRLLRRTKAEVLPQLPPKSLSDHLLPMTPKQEKAYNQMVKTMLADVGTGVLWVTDPLTQLNRLRYLASSLPLLDEEGAIASLSSKRSESNKLDAILDILEGDDGQLVVYAESRRLIEALAEGLSPEYKCGLITGSVPPAVRQANVDLFQNGKLDIILATTGAGAEGITLTAASRLVMAQESWSNVANKQAHDRIHRIGQTEHAEIITLMSEGTIDVAVHEACYLKEEQLQSVVRDPDWVRAAMKGEPF